MSSARDVFRAARAVPPRAFLRAIIRAPLEIQASTLLHGLPEVQLVDLTGEFSFLATIAPPATRHGWSLHATDQLALQAMLLARRVRTVFEIGTFNGGTTRLIAETIPADGRVVTLDLPPATFDETQHPDAFTGTDVGAVYRDSPAAGKIEQVLCDSLTFDVSAYAGQFDVVLVDGAHDYVHVMADTNTALRLIAPGGIILFDDFAPYWHGLVRGITAALDGRDLARVAGTALGVHRAAP